MPLEFENLKVAISGQPGRTFSLTISIPLGHLLNRGLEANSHSDNRAERRGGNHNRSPIHGPKSSKIRPRPRQPLERASGWIQRSVHDQSNAGQNYQPWRRNRSKANRNSNRNSGWQCPRPPRGSPRGEGATPALAAQQLERDCGPSNASPGLSWWGSRRNSPGREGSQDGSSLYCQYLSTLSSPIPGYCDSDADTEPIGVTAVGGNEERV